MGFDRIFALAEEGLDPQVLFDPFEKQLHPPAIFIELRYGHSGKRKIVRKEHQRFSGFRIVELDAPQGTIEPFSRVVARQYDGLIADQPCRAINIAGIAAAHLGVGFCARHEKASGIVKSRQTLEIQIAAIHDIECGGLGLEKIENFDIMHQSLPRRSRCSAS